MNLENNATNTRGDPDCPTSQRHPHRREPQVTLHLTTRPALL
jgi:hypothetical protein